MKDKIFKEGKSAFIPFIMAGHPTLEDSIEAIIALAEAGADAIEIGMPFSDPVADGPVNQHAAEIALSNGVTLYTLLNIVHQVRMQGYDIPIILFSYLNPILTFGYESFSIKAKEAGIDAVLMVDLPPEEGEEFYLILKKTGLEIVLLTSPTTNPQRFALYKKLDPSFIYYISRLSVTGIQSDLVINLEDEVNNLRTYFPGIKIAVGFGISNLNQAAQVAEFSDGVIIGSILVKTLQEQGLKEFKKLAVQFAQIIGEKNENHRG
jgi:tryptophan synthase alpha chain